ncbi:hemin-degrading factor [Moheibacter lacus]|uniref:Hemin-degrading factor n=1 Tax=Moheibacter lacus TaxID=2745851 RepID=A0A838ZRS7_9FLAO|nr:ChuX/HutX family heme-like substrate-binding protein [Moheibacter lacus]MBA5628489.1 hemin-degrading factor [Moheibacter lacus]
MNIEANTLKEKWNALKAEQPQLRIRNAADALGVSEGELLSTQVGEEVTVLKPDFPAILSEIESLGKVMALTRNDQCVHERKGVYLNGDFSSPHAQLFVGEDIDLRIFLSQWKFAFAVVEGDKKSLQFFGKDGLAIHKIYLTKDSNPEAFDALVEKFTAEEQPTGIQTEAIAPKAPEKPDSEIDVAGFQTAWKELKDTHDFFMMLRKFGVSRVQALRLAPDATFAKKIDNEKVVSLLEQASARDLPIMVFVGNRGNIQIHTGNVKKVMWHGPWFNVLDPNFNLHLDTSRIADTWVVRKPTDDGMVTAVEVFDKNGEIIVQFFGKRKPGIPELETWRDLVAELEA